MVFRFEHSVACRHLSRNETPLLRGLLRAARPFALMVVLARLCILRPILKQPASETKLRLPRVIKSLRITYNLQCSPSLCRIPMHCYNHYRPHSGTFLLIVRLLDQYSQCVIYFDNIPLQRHLPPSPGQTAAIAGQPALIICNRRALNAD